MNKYLKLSLIFTGLWILTFAVMSLYPYLFDIDSIGLLEFYIGEPIFSAIFMGVFYVFYYGAFLIMGLAIFTGIIASRQIIKAKEKLASVAVILASANALLLFGVIYASWPF